MSCGVKCQRLIVEENPQSPAIALSLTGRRRILGFEWRAAFGAVGVVGEGRPDWVLPDIEPQCFSGRMQQAVIPENGVREVIDRAAREVAWESGLSAITLRRVSSRARLDPGTVARYEPSMTALAARVFRRIAAEELELVTRGAGEFASAVDALWFVAEQATADSEGNDDWLWADAWSAGSRNIAVAVVAREINEAWTGLIENLVEQGIRSGEFAGVDSQFVARTFLALVDGSGVRSVFGGDTANTRTGLVTTFLAGALGVDHPVASCS
jgi:AcrR family transcriptional regulator